jgi:hypothetical protein
MNVYFKFGDVQQNLALHLEFIRLILFAIDNQVTLVDGGPYAISYPRELQVQSGEVVLVDARTESVYSQPLTAAVIDDMRSKVKPIDRAEFASRVKSTSSGDVLVPWR